MKTILLTDLFSFYGSVISVKIKFIPERQTGTYLLLKLKNFWGSDFVDFLNQTKVTLGCQSTDSYTGDTLFITRLRSPGYLYQMVQ